ncbi:hypothetical protein [Vibrio panuliri]|uniref:Uncharacterized protein n=1 Tax=Vibrio panuliri TaxID=1381081 RepID=A0A1Q9HR60_9VIBR|nr:hypothetical protein [Vibrio panuliri]KAB1458200.1 hypothetical protein F7O85_10875 [Vibrio panuliri]OLQ93315.1 hypothetical protein BIY22_02155 [Vibrio panuliri]OLQ95940.1 hypothetical protein BIY20_20560 [Vibrio panuliri]
MKKALVIALSVLSVSAFAAHAAFSHNDMNGQAQKTEQVIKAIGNGAISFGMNANQIENAVK